MITTLMSPDIDGPTEIHDKHRIDFKGLGTLSAVEAGLDQLRRVGITREF